jgi:hypothetical protein
MVILGDASKNSPLFELFRVLVRFNHVASIIVNTNHCIVSEIGEVFSERLRRVTGKHTRRWRKAD